MSAASQGRLEILLRFAVTALLFIEVVTQFAAQPYLHDPTAIGTDPSNYYAAGLRLNAGHSLYGPLLPSDRPTPFVPPYYTVPLLSPPAIAVLWRPIALLPGSAAMLMWWVVMGISMIAVTLWMIWVGTKLQLRLIIAMLVTYPVVALLTGLSTPWISVFPGIPDSAVSGNVNGSLVILLAAVWWAAASNRQAAAGLAAAVATAVKLLPGLLFLLFVVTRQRRAASSFLLGCTALLLITIAGAGWNNTLDYFAVVRQTGLAGATPLSLPGIAETLGAPPAVAASTIPILIIVTLGFALAFRHRPGWVFSAIIVTVVFGSPVVHQGTYALLLAAFAPFGPSPLDRTAPPMEAVNIRMGGRSARPLPPQLRGL